MSLTIDASVFIAASRLEEAHYPVSRRFLQNIRAQGVELFCPTLVLPECAAAIARPTGNSRLAGELALLVESFPRLQLVPLDLSLAHRAVQIAMDCHVRGADSVYIAIARAFAANLITWDREMLERGADIVTTMSPADWLGKNVVAER